MNVCVQEHIFVQIHQVGARHREQAALKGHDKIRKEPAGYMKKILYITTISGFLPQFEKNDVKIMQEMGYEIHYASNFHNPIYFFDKNKLIEQGIILHQIDVLKSPLKLRENVRAVRQLRQIIDEEQIDVIHCHNPMGGVAGRAAAHLSSAAPYVIYTAHGLHFYQGAPLLNWLLFYPAEKFLARWTDVIVTINEEDYLRVKRKFRLKPHGLVKQIHGVGVDMKRFRSRPEESVRKRKELGIPETAFHIVTAAELNDNKNQKVIIEAIAGLDRKNICYSLCGKGSNEEALRKLVAEKHLEDRVRLLGFRTDMEEILQTADVFAFPSIREGLGIAAVEALACGVPLIVSDNRGSREYAENDRNSIVCEASDVESFRQAIRRLYEDAEYRERLAGYCRRSAEKFSVRETMEIMRTVYRKADERIMYREAEERVLYGETDERAVYGKADKRIS